MATCGGTSGESGGVGNGGGAKEFNTQEASKCCFLEWMKMQERDLSELLHALAASPRDDAALNSLAEKALSHFESYMEQRSQLARRDAAAFFAPTWCSPWEKSLLWIAGCRPSAYFRLIYALTGLEIEAGLPDFLGGGNTPASILGSLSLDQLRLVDELQRRTIREEEKLTSKLAGLQEDVADQPLAVIVKWASDIGGPSEEVDRALDEHEQGMAKMLVEADGLRLSTVRKILAVLSPVQGADFLAMSKKLHLCIHQWSKKRDQRRGRPGRLLG